MARIDGSATAATPPPLENERKQREIADKRRRTARYLALTAAAGFVLAASIGIWALDQKHIADRALNDLEKAVKETKKVEFYQAISDMKIILESPDGCPDNGQRIQLDTVPPHYPEDTALQKHVNDLRQQFRNKNCPL